MPELAFFDRSAVTRVYSAKHHAGSLKEQPSFSVKVPEGLGLDWVRVL